jgi:hypothetical protein
MQENIEMCAALLMKLNVMQKKYLPDAPGSKERMLQQMQVEARIIVEQMTKHVAVARWSWVVDACEAAIIMEERAKVSCANVVKWVKAYMIDRNQQSQNKYRPALHAPREASIEDLERRYHAQLALWAHGKPVWDLGFLALSYLVRMGKISAEPTAQELARLEPYINAAKAAKSAGEKRLRRPLDISMVSLHEQQYGAPLTIVNHARLMYYIESNENKQEWQAKLPAPTSLLG